MKEAVILAAGRGRRLERVSNGRPKCLVQVGGVTLIERQLTILRSVGIKRITVVVGHRADEVRTTVGDRAAFIENARYAETNSLYSLWLARGRVRGPFMLMNADVLAHPDIYHRVLAHAGCALAYDSESGDDDEHMKVSVDREGCITEMSKALPDERTEGENVGVLQFDADGARLLFDAAETLIQAGDVNAWAPQAVSRLSAVRPIRAVDIAGLPWTEIDFPEDLQAADRHVSPVIERGRWTIDTRPARDHMTSIAS